MTARKTKKVSAFGTFDTRLDRGIRRAVGMIGRAPPEEIRYFLPWGGHSPTGREILAAAEEAWKKRAT